MLTDHRVIDRPARRRGRASRLKSWRAGAVSLTLVIAAVLPFAPIRALAAASWSTVASPTGAGYSSFQGVAAVSATNLLAVGYGNPATTPAQTLAAQGNGTGWAPVPSANTSASVQNTLNAVAVVSASDAWAVGYFGSPAQTLIERWNGSAWTVVPSPNVTSNTSNNLRAVAVVSATNVWAVGYYAAGTIKQTLIEHWDGTSWTIAASPNTSSSSNNGLDGIVAVAANDMWAVGFANGNAALFEHWNGTSWSITLSAAFPAGNAPELKSASAVSSSDIYAVGQQSLAYGDEQLAFHWNGTAWSDISPPTVGVGAPCVTTAGGQLTEDFYSVAVVTTTDVWAVGTSGCDGISPTTSTKHWNGTSWVNVADAAVGGILYGVVALSSTNVWAVGSKGTATFTEHWFDPAAGTCSGGALTLTAPASLSFPATTVTAATQTRTATMALTADDETGTGNGWNLAATSTTFANGGGKLLRTNASTATGSSVAAATGNCSLPTNAITYPLTIPAAVSPPTAVKIYNAAASTGKGPATVTMTFALAVDGNVFSGSYTSTWTLSMASGP